MLFQLTPKINDQIIFFQELFSRTVNYASVILSALKDVQNNFIQFQLFRYFVKMMYSEKKINHE